MDVRIINPTGHPSDTDIYDEAGGKFRNVTGVRFEHSSRDKFPQVTLEMAVVPVDLKGPLSELTVTVYIPSRLTMTAAELEAGIQEMIRQRLQEK
jgi:hypothetical protein